MNKAIVNYTTAQSLVKYIQGFHFIYRNCKRHYEAHKRVHELKKKQIILRSSNNSFRLKFWTFWYLNSQNIHIVTAARRAESLYLGLFLRFFENLPPIRAVKALVDSKTATQKIMAGTRDGTNEPVPETKKEFLSELAFFEKFNWLTSIAMMIIDYLIKHGFEYLDYNQSVNLKIIKPF